MVQSSLGKMVHETLSPKQATEKKGYGRVAQVIEHLLLSKCDALNSKSSINKKKERKAGRKEGRKKL
jgi:hypothetical protein